MGDQPPHVQLAVGQALSHVRGAGGAFGAPHHSGGDGRIEHRVAGNDGIHRVHERFGPGVLEQETARPGVQRAEEHLVVIEGRQHDDPHRRRLDGQFGGGGNAVAAGHPHIHQDDVRVRGAHDRHGLLAVAGLPAHLNSVRVQDGAQGDPHHRLVIDDDHPRWPPRTARLSHRWTLAGVRSPGSRCRPVPRRRSRRRSRRAHASRPGRARCPGWS